MEKTLVKMPMFLSGEFWKRNGLREFTQDFPPILSFDYEDQMNLNMDMVDCSYHDVDIREMLSANGIMQEENWELGSSLVSTKLSSVHQKLNFFWNPF